MSALRLYALHCGEEIERSEQARLLTTHALDFETSVRMAPDAWYE
jgi:hypothetical protein